MGWHPARAAYVNRHYRESVDGFARGYDILAAGVMEKTADMIRCRRFADLRTVVFCALCTAAALARATPWTNCFKVVEYSDLRHVQCTVEDLQSLDLCFDRWESNRWEVIDHSGGPGVQLARVEKWAALSGVTYQSGSAGLAGTQQPFRVAFRADFNPVGIRWVYHGWLSVANSNGTFAVLGSAMDMVTHDLSVGDGESEMSGLGPIDEPDEPVQKPTHVWTDPDTGLRWVYVDYGDSCCGVGSGLADCPALDPCRCAGEIEIPESIEGRTVVAVEPYAFSQCPIDNLAVPSSVTSVCSRAFAASRLRRLVFEGDMPAFEPDALTGADAQMVVCVRVGAHGWPNDAQFGAYAFRVLEDNDRQDDTTCRERIDGQGIRWTDTCESWHCTYREADLSGGKWVRLDLEEWYVSLRTQQTDDPSTENDVAYTNGWSRTQYRDLEHVRTYDMCNEWKVCQGDDADCYREEWHDTYDEQGKPLAEAHSLWHDGKLVRSEERTSTYVCLGAQLAYRVVNTERIADGLCNWVESVENSDDDGRVCSRQVSSGQYDVATGRRDWVGVGPGDGYSVAADSAADALAQVVFSCDIPVGEKDDPISVSVADYIGYFKPTATDLGDGQWHVAFDVDPTAIGLSASVAAILPQLSGRTADAVPDITLPGKPGLYYGIAYAEQAVGPYRCDRFVLATGDTVDVPAPPSSGCLFMRVVVRTKE